MLKSIGLLGCFAVVCFFMACEQDPPYDKDAQQAIDDAIITKFIAAENIPAKKTDSGLYYQIINPGKLPIETIRDTDIVGINYVGRLLDGTVFDATPADTTKFMMTEVIQGWQQGIRLIGVGGEIRLIIPSTMAYRDRLVGTLPPTTNNPLPGPLPANSILDFDIKLIAINPKPVQPN